MASPWENIMASPEFSAMTPEQKQRTRDIFFDEAIAPEAGGNTEVLEKARGYFNSQFDFMPKPQPEQEPGAMGAFLQSAKHEAGSGLGGGIGGALGAMGAGALAGASSGSVVPGWGTLAGGIVGALAGGFLGKKTQQAIQGKEAYEKEAQELAKVAEQHPIATSTGALLPLLPTMILAPGAGAITKIAGIGDEVTNIAAQAIRRASPQLTDDAVKMAANSFRLMKPADAVKYAQSLGLGDDAANAIQNAAVSTAQRLGGQALESGVQMGIMAGGESAAQVAEGNKSIADIPGDILKGVVTGAPLGLMGPVALGKGKLGSALGGALIKGPADAALMATGEEAYDAATGKSDGFSLQRAGERAVGMLPSFSLLAGGMGVFHGKPEFKKPPELKPQEADTSLLPELAKPESIQEHEAIQNYLRAKESGNPDELVRAADELAKAREADIPQPTPLEKAAAQTENAGSSPVLTEALKTASANLDAQKAAEMDRQLSQMEDEGLLADVISAEREKALQRQEAEAAKQREEQYQKLKEQQNAIPERSAEEVGAYPSGDEGIGRTEESQRVGPIEQRIETTPEENRELGGEKIDFTEGAQRNRDILQEAANKLKGLQKAPEISSVFPALFKLLKRQGDPLQKAPEIPSVFPETIPAPSEGQIVKELNKEVEVTQPQVDISGMERDTSKPEQMTPEESYEAYTTAKELAPNLADMPKTKKQIREGIAIAENSGIKDPELQKMFMDSAKSETGQFAGPYIKAQRIRLIEEAMEGKKPVSAEAVDTYGITLPEGYVRQGDLYVFQPKETPTSPVAPTPEAGTLSSGQRDTSKPEQMTPEEVKQIWATAKEWAETPDTEIAQKYQTEFSASDAYMRAHPFAPENWREGQKKLLKGKAPQKQHELAIGKAFGGNQPVSKAAVDAYGIAIPEGYIQDGELYVYRPSGTVEAKPAPPAKPAPQAEQPAPQRDTSKPEQMTTGERGQNINPDFNNWGSFKTRKAAQQALDDRIDNVPPNSPMHNIAGEYGLTIRDLYKIGKGQLPSGKIAWGIGKTPQHEIAVGAQQELPISSEAVEAYGIKLPKGYVRQGDLYVFRPENTAAPEGGPIPRGGVNEFPETQREDRPAVVDEQITPEVTESTKEIAPEDRALISLNEFISTIKNEKGRASWTPEVIAKAQKFFQSHDVNDLAGLNKVQSSRIKEIERQSFPEIQKQVRAEGRNLAKKEREDELFAKEIPKEREDELFAKEIPKERAEEPVEEVFSDEDMDNLSAQIRRDLDAEGLRPSIAGGEEKIPAEAKASSDLIAARGNFEEAQKAFNEAHQPIPIAEATPERIDSILARRKQTADSLEAAKAKLKYEAVRDLTKHLPWEQRTKEMEGITDADTLEKHKQSVKEAAAQRKPVSIEASKEYGIKLDSDYQADRFGIARPTLDRRIQPFKEYGERGAITSEKVSPEQVREAIKSLPAEVRRMLEKSGFDIISREEASKLDGITPEFTAKAEGFFYNGKIYVIPENIKVTTKDVSALKAAARVLVHENLHEAFNAVVAKDPKAMEEWKGMLKQIPENDLEALARDYQKGDDWRRDPKTVTDLAEEWLAKKWEDYQGGKMVEAEKPIFERILNSIRKIIERVFGGVRQFKTQDEDLEAFFDKLSKDRLRVKGGEGELKASLPIDEAAEKERLGKMPVTPEMDAKYMEAVKNGDMETAQRMVDEAANRAGYTTKAYHGTQADVFYIFNPLKGASHERKDALAKLGSNFSADDVVAARFATGEAQYSRNTKIGRIIPVFLNLGKSTPVMPEKKAVSEFKKGGYDSISYINEAPSETKGAKDKTAYVVPNPSRIKSADPVTYDNEGNPMPLSERFNPESPDIRFSIPTSEEAERERQFGKNLFGLSMEAMRKQSSAFETGEMKRVRLDYGEELFNRVRKAVEKDSGLGKRAVDRILSNEGGLATQEEEVAMALEVAKLTRQLTSFDERLDEPGISSADVNSILNQIDATKDQMNRTMQAIYESGTKLSRAFYARQLAFNNKYELQNIYQRARRAKGGAKLTKEEESKIFSQAERILKDTEAFDKLEREKDKLKIPDLIDLIAKQVDEIKAKGQRLGDEGAAVLRETPPTPGLRGFDLAYESLNDFMKDRVNRLDNRMSDLNSLRAELAKRKQISEAKASLPESELSAMTEAEILRKIEELEKGIAEDVGAISQGLGIEKKKKTPKTILEEAKKKIAELNEPIEPSKPRKKTPLQQLLEEHSDTRMSLDDFVKKSDELGLDKETATRLYRDFNSRKGAYAQELPDSVYGRLLRKFVEEGERDTNEIAKKISKWLGDNGYGDISPGDVMERVSGYGKKIFPSQEEVAKISRQKRAEMLVLSQIRDIEENLRAPELTGAQRDKAHAELRELMKKRNDMMRDLGIQRQSPEAQFANARDRAIRALENRREELMRILSGEKEYRRRENKTRIKDADEKALFEEVRKLSDQVRDLYDKDEPITAEKWNAERERRLTKAIDAIRERIKKGNFLSNEKAEFERTESVKGLEETLESLREDFNQMKDAAHPELKIEAKQKAITKALNDRIIDLNKIIENGRELSEKSNVPETPEMKEAREVIKELNEKLKIKEWPDRRLESLQKSLEKADKAINSNLPPEAKKKYENLKTLEIKQAEEDLKNKRYTRLLQSQERKWKKKLADQDFTPKKKEQRALDDKQKEIKRRIEETKEEIEKTIKDLQFEQLSPLEKAGEYLVRWKRYAILSSPISVFKLTSAAMTRAGTMGIENYMRTPFDILFPKAAGELRKIGVLESRATSKEYADAIAKGLSDGMRDAADTLKKGQSEIDAKYGKKNMDKEGWTNFFGRLHGMLKAPVKRSAFELAMSKQIRGFMAEKGREPSPDELLPMQMRAYEWANRQIFMNDNAITSAWNSSLNTLEQKGYKNLASLARFMLPIVKVPTNIAKETLQYTPLGIAKGTYDMMNVVRAGLESIKDKPEIAESILRNFNKGFIGTGLMMLGYAMPQIAGGFYEKGEKRHEDEPDFGEMMIGGVRIPKWMLHAPFFEVIQLGSTMRRAVDHSMEKHGERDYAEGAVSGLKGVLDELPFIAEMGRVSDAFDNQKSRNRFLGDLAASAIIPAAVGYTARKSDTEAPEGAGLIERLSAPTVKRETVGETLGETIKKSVQAQVPGLREQLLPRVDNPFGPGIKVPKPLQDWEKAGHPMPSVSTRVDFEKGYGKVSDARWMTYVSTRGRAIRQAMAEKLPQLMSMPEEDKRRAIQQITKRASSEGRVAIGLSG